MPKEFTNESKQKKSGFGSCLVQFVCLHFVSDADFDSLI